MPAGGVVHGHLGTPLLPAIAGGRKADGGSGWRGRKGEGRGRTSWYPLVPVLARPLVSFYFFHLHFFLGILFLVASMRCAFGRGELPTHETEGVRPGLMIMGHCLAFLGGGRCGVWGGFVY